MPESEIGYTFKIADEDWEFEQIHRLNYSTFVEEIPQHQKNTDGMLVDKFHLENTYLICVRGKSLLGMVAVRGTRPFSLDHKLNCLDSYLPTGRTVCEVRLLAVAKEVRSSRVFQGLMNQMLEFCTDLGYDYMIISATVRQLKLYNHLGFMPFGPRVGTPDAEYQPMYLSREAFISRARSFERLLENKSVLKQKISFLPGPVSIAESVKQIFGGEPVSHRSEIFIQDFQQIKKKLCDLSGARYVEIFLGSGTLANDIIAAQLSLDGKQGLVLSNGEFGERLIDHAARAGLNFQAHRTDWGESFNLDRIGSVLKRMPETNWLWAAHCETSTGVLNDMQGLKHLCRNNSIRLCLDCVSSIGSVPIDLEGVYLASGVSGKALGAFPGLSMVFYNHAVDEAKTLARYLDLGYYRAKGGIPFTQSSNLIYALGAALDGYQGQDRFAVTQQDAAMLTERLKEKGFQIVSIGKNASPAAITLALPPEISSEKVGRNLDEAGITLSYRSSYLLERNWLQICLMGNYPRQMLNVLTDMLCRACS